MPVAISVTISLFLIIATVLLHYELLQFASTLPARLAIPTRPRKSSSSSQLFSLRI